MIVAWIWSLLFYMGLDPLKWAMAWATSKSGLHRPASVTHVGSKVGARGFTCSAANMAPGGARRRLTLLSCSSPGPG